MQKMVYKLTAGLTALVLAVAGALTVLLTAPFTVNALSPATSGNRGMHNYSRWASTVKSYLYSDGDVLVRVECIGVSNVIVEQYSKEFQLLSSQTLSLELPVWGGFYAGEDANYIICGQTNEEENNNKEVIRVVKYDKEFHRLGSASLYGANTTVPFEAGSLRCDEVNGTLYVRTCHEMYTSDDGLNHQANMTFSVRESDMKIMDATYLVEYSGVGYASHSFNQYILVDEEGYLVALDHGDAYPRGVVLNRSVYTAGNGEFDGISDSVLVQYFPGATGDNSTGAAVGGLAETSSGYLAVYSANTAGSGMAKRNVYLSYTPKDRFTGNATVVTQITDYAGTGYSDPSAGNPMIVPTGPDEGYILWNDVLAGSSEWDGLPRNTDLHYVTYSSGGKVSSVQTVEDVWLSDCQPVFVDGKLVWYTTNSGVNQGAPTFYTLDESGLTAIAVRSLTSIEVTSQPDKTVYLEGEKLDSTGLEVTAYYDNGTAEVIEGYTLSGFDSSRLGQQTVTVSYQGFTASFSVTVEQEQVLLYDYNRDNVEDVLDVMWLAQQVVDESAKPAQDLNQDGVVDVLDVMTLAKRIV